MLSNVDDPLDMGRGGQQRRAPFFNRLMRPVAKSLATSRVVRWTWGDAQVPDFYPVLSEILPVDPASASEMLEGQYLLAAQTVETKGVSPFAVMAPNFEWYDALHRFAWLRHFSGSSESSVMSFARTLVIDWITRYGSYDEDCWQPITTSVRVCAWLRHLPVLLDGATAKQKELILRSLQKQAQSLKARLRFSMNDFERIHAHLALIAVALSQRAENAALDMLLIRLVALLRHQITSDGVHIDRNPQTGFEILVELIPIRIALSEGYFERLDEISDLIGIMIGGLKYFQHWDGELAAFNGGCMVPIDELMAVLSHDDLGRATADDARVSGYQRLRMGKSVLIADVGCPPKNELAATCHGGILSFEFSQGQDLVICNAGPTPFKAEPWAKSFRDAAAHSCLLLENLGAARVARKGSRAGWMLFNGGVGLEERTDDPVGFKAYHTGYVQQFGYAHHRALSLTDGGHVLMGVDILRDVYDRANPKQFQFTIHFHLVPSTLVQQDVAGGEVRLQVSSGNVWVFQCVGAQVSVAPSERVSKLFGRQPTNQLIISGMCAGETSVNWRLSLMQNPQGIATPFGDAHNPAL